MTRLLLVLTAAVLGACAGAAPPTPAESPATTLEITAEGSVFDRDHLAVPADTTFALRFINHDAVPHNVSIRGAPTPLVGEIFGGPAERTYVFAGLPAGSYTFLCDVHPEMRGTVEAGSGSSRP